MTLDITDEERDYLLEILEAQREELLHELHHTDTLDFKEMLKRKVELVEAVRSKGAHVECGGRAVEDELGEELAERGRVHDAVARRAVGEVEVLKTRRATQKRVLVRRHLVESGPASLPVNQRPPQTRHALVRAADDF